MPSRSEYDGIGVSYYHIPNFRFHDGTQLSVKIAYRSFNPTAQKVACLPTCYGGRINDTLNFTTGALKDHHVVVIAMLGNGESSSPSNTAEFPQPDYQDCISSQYELLTKELKVKELEVVAGFSMGGQQAYYWASMYPDFVKNAVVICGSARTSGHNYAFLEGPKAALLNSIDYADGAYKPNGPKPLRGLHAFGRAYCASALSAAWFREKIWQTKFGFDSVDKYIDAWANDAFMSWDPEDVLVLARMWQAGDVGALREDGAYEKVLGEIKARILVMPSRTDQYFPWSILPRRLEFLLILRSSPEDSEIEMRYLKRGKFVVMETVWGHVAGGGANEDDTKFMDTEIDSFLRSGFSVKSRV